jgi:hypothetical protein
MRALSSNLEEHQEFLSTPKFLSDLLFVSEMLKNTPKEERNEFLRDTIIEINKTLPANVYIPIP